MPRWISLSLDAGSRPRWAGRVRPKIQRGALAKERPNLLKNANLCSIMRLYYAGCADIRAFDDDVFRRGASPCRPTFRRTCRARPDLCMSWFSWWRSSPSPAPLAASGLRHVALDRGLARRLAKPASTCALDCLQFAELTKATKPFRKPQSPLISFPSARQLRGDRGSCISGGGRASRRIGGAMRDDG
jgi:hypothetical protein